MIRNFALRGPPRGLNTNVSRSLQSLSSRGCAPESSRSGPTVVYISHTSELYGAERSLLTLVRGQQDAGRRPIVVAPTQGPLVDLLRTLGIDVRVVRFGYWLTWRKRRFDRLFALATLLRLRVTARRLSVGLRELEPACVYTNTLATPLGAFLASDLGCPHVVHVREFVGEAGAPRLRLGRRATTAILRRSTDLFIHASHALLQYYASVLPGVRSHVVHNGFAFRSLGELDCGRARHRRLCAAGAIPVVTFLGKASAPKNHCFALDVLKTLVEDGRNVRFSFVGGATDDYRRERDQYCRQLGLDAYVTCRDFRANLAEVFDESFVVALTSDMEPFGRCLVEALGEGIPAIAVNAGGPVEILDDDRTGFLVPPGDPRAFADRIGRLLDDAETYARLSEAGRCEVRARFSEARYTAEVNACLERLGHGPR
jgi:glycosyltransferase involved in cell wall biosynthesis